MGQKIATLKHKLNVHARDLSIIVLCMAIGQLDNFCSAILWATHEADKTVEIWSLPGFNLRTTVGQWYNLMWLAVVAAFLLYGYVCSPNRGQKEAKK